MAAQNFAGVLVPVLTPFARSGDPDAGRFVAFCRFLLDQGVTDFEELGPGTVLTKLVAQIRKSLAAPA